MTDTLISKAVPWTATPGEHLFRLPQSSFDGYVMKVDPSDPDGFTFIGRNETINLTEGDDFVTMPRVELYHLLNGRTPAHLMPGIPALSGAERSAVGEIVRIKREARRLANGNEKRYRREMKRLSREHVRAIQRKISETETVRDQKHRQLASIERDLAIITELMAWVVKPPRLQCPEGCSLHRLQKAYASGHVLMVKADDEVSDYLPTENGEFLEDVQAFVVEHDWAKVIDGATISGQGGEIQIPADQSAFEFLVNDCRVIAGVCSADDDPYRKMVVMCETSHGWGMLPPIMLTDAFLAVQMDVNTPERMKLSADCHPLIELVAKNIKAICIMLEAEVATTEVIRVDAKLNHAREKRGKLPLSDYHVVSLTRRDRAVPLARSELDPDREIRHVRMHFRRGHWRHYQNHRTWIKWMLVGDPDLGIIEKHYRL